jgi:hypothetical protein
MRNGKKHPSIVRSASRGALAGLIGGAAMATAERVVLPRIPGYRAPRAPKLDRRLADAAKLLGWEMTPRARAAAGVTTQLMYAALLGAIYGAIVSRQPSRSTRQLLNASIRFAASLLAPELEQRPPRRRRRSRVSRLRAKALEPVTPSNVFGQATGLALRALMR